MLVKRFITYVVKRLPIVPVYFVHQTNNINRVLLFKREMIHTSEQAIEAARKILEQYQIKHMKIGTLQPKTSYQLRPGAPIIDAWVVNYTYMVFQEEDAFIYLNDQDELNLIYIMTGHGYLTTNDLLSTKKDKTRRRRK